MEQNILPRRLPLPEFIALMAMLSAIVAFSIDAMLPALPEIAQELSPADPNKAQLILTSFVLGLGIGTFFAGPLSDAFGRRPTIVAGAVLYCLGAVLAWIGSSLEMVLLGRLIQGLGAAAPRIVSIALVRDLYQGRQMARIMSFVMMIFTLVPAMAPLIGSQIIAFTGWRGIFPAFVLFAIAAMIWFTARQEETLLPAARRPVRLGLLWLGLREVLSRREAQISIATQSLLFAALFGTLSQIQPLFDQTFGRAATFPLWFAAIALASGTASLMNAALVVRLGMRRMVRLALIVQSVFSGLMAVAMVLGLFPEQIGFAAFLIWICGVFFMVGFTLGNINAIAMEPLGHIAGMAASVIAAVATVIGVAIAVPLGLAFDGTVAPLAFGVALLAGLGALLQRWLPPAPRA